MRHFQYNLTIYREDEEIEFRTNDINRVFAEMNGCEGKSLVTDGFTGEILYDERSEEVYTTTEFSLMILGWAFLNN